MYTGRRTNNGVHYSTQYKIHILHVIILLILLTTVCKLKTTNNKGLLPLQRGPVESQEWRHTTIELQFTWHSVACIFQCTYFSFKCSVCSVYCVVCGVVCNMKW